MNKKLISMKFIKSIPDWMANAVYAFILALICFLIAYFKDLKNFINEPVLVCKWIVVPLFFLSFLLKERSKNNYINLLKNTTVKNRFIVSEGICNHEALLCSRYESEIESLCSSLIFERIDKNTCKIKRHIYLELIKKYQKKYCKTEYKEMLLHEESEIGIQNLFSRAHEFIEPNTSFGEVFEIYCELEEQKLNVKTHKIISLSPVLINLIEKSSKYDSALYALNEYVKYELKDK